MARWLYDNPGRICTPPGTPDRLTYEEAATALGLPIETIKAFVRLHAVSRERDWSAKGGVTFVSLAELERAMVRLRDDRRVIDAPGIRIQRLHETLIVAFRHEMKPDATTIHQIAVPVEVQQVYYFRGAKIGSTENASAFKRYDVKLSDGSYPRITTHQFRHWLNTVALRGGMNELELARWMDAGGFKTTSHTTSPNGAIRLCHRNSPSFSRQFPSDERGQLRVDAWRIDAKPLHGLLDGRFRFPSFSNAELFLRADDHVSIVLLRAL